MRTKGFWIAGALSAAQAFAPDARACGGCFIPPSTDSVVTGHRMAFAVTGDRTVLWDQIQYSGEPTEFAWVLPIAPGAYIEPSTDAWFEALETATVTQVTAPQLQCAQNDSGGCALGFASADSGSLSESADFGGRGVTVLHRGTVGPYETVTLRSTNGGELREWLDGHGYAVPPDIDPVIDTYVAEGADFIALRLQPGQGVDQMTPVRVVTPSGPPILPLRMVAAGTGNFTEIVLYVIAEDRYGLDDLVESQVDMASLTYDLATNETNYARLRKEALREPGAYRYLTTFARERAFFEAPGPDPSPGFFPAFLTSDGTSADTLGDLYLAQARVNAPGVAPTLNCNVNASLSEARLVVEGTPAAGQISANVFHCGTPFTDLSAAMTGMHPASVWLTRLEMNLPREALTMDCNVGVADAQTEVSNQLTARELENRPVGCVEPVFVSRVAATPPRAAHNFGWGVGVFAALALLRRARGRRR